MKIKPVSATPFVFACALLAATCSAQQSGHATRLPSADPEKIRAHVKYLSSDALEGRGMGQPGEVAFPQRGQTPAVNDRIVVNPNFSYNCTAVRFSAVTVSVSSRNFCARNASAEATISIRPSPCP